MVRTDPTPPYTGPAKPTGHKKEAATGRVDDKGGELLHAGAVGTIADTFLRMYVWIYDALFPPRILQEWTYTKPDHPKMQIISYRAAGGHRLWAGPLGIFHLPSATTKTTGSCSVMLSVACKKEPGRDYRDFSAIIKQHAGSNATDGYRHSSARALVAILEIAGKTPEDLIHSLDIKFIHGNGLQNV